MSYFLRALFSISGLHGDVSNREDENSSELLLWNSAFSFTWRVIVAGEPARADYGRGGVPAAGIKDRGHESRIAHPWSSE